MSELTGTSALIRAAVRRDRIRMLVWIAAIVLLTIFSGQSVVSLYGDPVELAKIAALSQNNVAAIVFNGPPIALDTLGGQVTFQVGTFGMIVTALMSIFTLGRLTRAEEESGRTELLLATPVGRHAPLAAALIVVTAMNVVVGVLIAAGLIALSLPVAGSISLGLGFTLVGLVFGSVAAVAAQITENNRVVYGASGALLGLAFMLRAVGDIGDGRVSWLSPIGWSQKLRPYDSGQVWWPVIVPLAVVALQWALAWVLADHRDVGAGLIAPRPGRPEASPSLGNPFGLALRLQRGSLIGWAIGVLALGVSYGSVANQISEFVADNEDLKRYLSAGQVGDLTLAFLSTIVLTLALLASGYAVQATLRLSSEESALRAEPLLATPLSRYRWAASHLAMAFGGSALVLLLANVGAAVTYGLIIGDFYALPKLALATFAYLPAMWVLVGVAVALYGLVPRFALAAWAVFAATFLIGFLADLLQLPDWLRDVSPFQHVPRVPLADVTVLPLVVLLAIAVGLTAVGLIGFRARDTPV